MHLYFYRKAIGSSMCQINLMHRLVKYRAEFHVYQEILPSTTPPCALNLSDTPNLIAYMQIRRCHTFYSVYNPDFTSYKTCIANIINIHQQ